MSSEGVEREVYLTPAEIGRRFDPLLSEDEVNALLVQYGYQVEKRDADGRVYYVPTEKGQQYAAYFGDEE